MESDHISLNWLYQQKKLELTPIVHGPATFRVISPTELLDPTEFLSPDSLVLTLGLSFENNQNSWESYVQRLAAAGVTAIGFGTGLVFPAVPFELISAAEQHRMGLFEVPRHIPFVSIIQTAHDELVRRSNRATERLLDIQEKLNRAALKGGIDQLLTDTASLLKAGVCLIDNDGRVVGAASADGISAQYFAKSFVQRTGGTRRTAAPIDAPPTPSSATVKTPRGDNHLVHRMAADGDRTHYLVLVSNEHISSAGRSVVKHCAGLLDILIQRPKYLRTKQAELNAMALAILLGAEGSQKAMAPVFANAADAEGNVRPVVLLADDETTLTRAIAELDTNLATLNRGLFAVDIAAGAVGMLFRGTRSVGEVLNEFGASRTKVRIAIGAPLTWTNLTMEVFQELQMRAKTVGIGECAGPADGVLRWTQDNHVQTLLRVRNEETYGRLQSYDATHATELAKTLATYLKSGGHVGETAQSLGVHRHTVRTRLGKISEICECDLDNPVTRAELLLVYVSHATE
ncbi:PucR family transcriptional regulator [Staphylococcus chromogenes]|nr:PucR family transcriptional regulator [Staphylococcus chromogenes]